MSVARSVVASVCALVLCACPAPEGGGGGGVPSGRCEVDLDATGLFSNVGTGARVLVVDSDAQLIGGPAADGRRGDVLLENDRIRVVLSQPGRHFATIPYGGWIVDADLQRASGEIGRDQFGRMGLLYAFGRTVRAEQVDILADGTQGGAAIVAVTGQDALNDFLNLNNQIGQYLPSAKLASDPNQPRTLRITTYYVVSPGEPRVRIYTAFCNNGPDIVSIPVAELIDRGGSTSLFNPEGCSGTMGATDCLVDPTHGFGFQGEGLAYGYRSYRFDNPDVVSQDALFTYGGISGVLAGAENDRGLLSWADPMAPKRPGTLGIRPGGQRTFLRDFFVTRDLGELTSTFLRLDTAPFGRMQVTVTKPDGSPVPGARVAVTRGDGRLITLLVADEAGEARAEVAPGAYQMLASAPGHALETPKDVVIGTSGTTEVALTLGPSHALNVRVSDPFGSPLPAKVTVLCPGGTCPTPAARYALFQEQEPLPTRVAAIAFVPPQGTLSLPLPPGAYEVVITRGPEYGAWPSTWPASGEPVDLTSEDQAVEAVLAKVVDSHGWMSADLHVHAVNSADSSVGNERRALSFLAEGVDVLVSTDHEAITDYGPVVSALGGESLMATMIGSELSSMDFGHFNAFPLVLRDDVRGGPFDWAGGDGPTLRVNELFSSVRVEHPGALVQINHPRGSMGVLTMLRVDTDTFASHADPLALRMSPSPDATLVDTRLFGDNFDAVEVMNGLSPSIAVLNDWMTMLSTGRRKVATAVSDSHTAFKDPGGYGRTWVDLDGVDAPPQFDPKLFAEGLRRQKAMGSNGPFVRVTARRMDAEGNAVGATVGIGETLSMNPAAGETVELSVDVQSPEWIRFDTIEVFTHAAGREALNGESNTSSPVPLKTVKLSPAALPVEAVPGMNGQEFRRIHLVQKIDVAPTADAWFVVVVRSTTVVGSLYPLAYAGVTCNGAVCTAEDARAFAFTNPVYVDADGSGSYDTFPQKVNRSIRVPPSAPVPPESPRAPTLEELNALLHDALDHQHE